LVASKVNMKSREVRGLVQVYRRIGVLKLRGKLPLLPAEDTPEQLHWSL
jgi:hypothetical protein